MEKNRYGFPACARDECFANKERGCVCLNDSSFGRRGCPFFKTKERYREGLERYGGLKGE